MGEKRTVHVGAKLEVKWPSDSEYYPATVVDYDSALQRAKVVYPRCDNAVEEFHLSDRVWRVAKRSRGRPLQDMLVGKHISITNDAALAETFHCEATTLRCYVLRRAGPARYDLLHLPTDRIAKGQNLAVAEYTVVTTNGNANGNMNIATKMEPISDDNHNSNNDNMDNMDMNMDMDFGMQLPHSPELSSVGDSNLNPPPPSAPSHHHNMPLMGVPQVGTLLLDSAPLFPPPPMPHGTIYSHDATGAVTNGRPNIGPGFDAGAVLDFVAAGGTLDDDVQRDSNANGNGRSNEGGTSLRKPGNTDDADEANEDNDDDEEEGEVKEDFKPKLKLDTHENNDNDEPNSEQFDEDCKVDGNGDDDDETDTKGRAAVDRFVQVSPHMDEVSRLAYVVGYSKSKRAHHLAWIDSVETTRALIIRPHTLLDDIPKRYTKKRPAPDSTSSLPGVAAKRPRVSALSLTRNTRDLVGRWIKLHRKQSNALVVGYKDATRRHLIYSARDERVEEAHLTEIEWSPCDIGQVQQIGGLVGKRIVVLDKSSSDDEDDSDGDEEATMNTMSAKELLFEAFVVERLGTTKYRLLYTYTGMMLVEDLRNRHKHWDLVPNDATEFKGKKIVSWSKSGRGKSN